MSTDGLRSVQVHWPGREELNIEILTNDLGQIKRSQITGIGGSRFLKKLVEFRNQLPKTVNDIPVPSGREREDILFREAVLKLKGLWKFPFPGEELCHCRAVLAQAVDESICAGASTSKAVSRLTSASTACGTCRPDVEAILRYRLDFKG